MNKIPLLLAMLVNALVAFAGKNDLTIRGTVTNPLADSVTFSYTGYEDNWLDFKSHVVSEPLDKNGNFIVMLPLPHNYTLIQIQNGEQATEIYASPGGKLTMTVDASNFDASLQYEGADAAVANFMAKHMLQYGFTQNFQVEMQQLIVKEPAEFETAINGRVAKELDFLVENSKGLPQSFIEFWNAFHEYQKYETMLMYPDAHEVMVKRTYDIGEVPKENYEVLKKVPAKFDDKFMYIDIYRTYLYRYHWAQLSAQGVKNETMVKGKEYLLFDKMLELSYKDMPKESAEYTFAFHFHSITKYIPIARAEYLMTLFKNRYPKSDYTATIERQLNIKRKLAPGAPAIDFTVTDADGKKIKLSELEGKVVYIDFWASWCGPCLAQFPHTKKIKEHFAGKDVVFVYVSIDEDEKAWKAAKKKHGLTGLHTRISGGWKAKLADEYGVLGVPSYFLVDKNGNFAVEITPRPSNTEQLIETIEALL